MSVWAAEITPGHLSLKHRATDPRRYRTRVPDTFRETGTETGRIGSCGSSSSFSQGRPSGSQESPAPSGVAPTSGGRLEASPLSAICLPSVAPWAPVRASPGTSFGLRPIPPRRPHSSRHTRHSSPPTTPASVNVWVQPHALWTLRASGPSCLAIGATVPHVSMGIFLWVLGLSGPGWSRGDRW